MTASKWRTDVKGIVYVPILMENGTEDDLKETQK